MARVSLCSPVWATSKRVLLGDGWASTTDAVFPIITSLHCIINCIHSAVTVAAIVSHGSAYAQTRACFCLARGCFWLCGNLTCENFPWVFFTQVGWEKQQNQCRVYFHHCPAAQPLPRTCKSTPMSAASRHLPHFSAAGHFQQQGFEWEAQSVLFSHRLKFWWAVLSSQGLYSDL